MIIFFAIYIGAICQMENYVVKHVIRMVQIALRVVVMVGMELRVVPTDTVIGVYTIFTDVIKMVLDAIIVTKQKQLFHAKLMVCFVLRVVLI